MNKDLAERLKNIPYSERIVLLPQCLRSNQCKAPKKEFGIVECQKCYQKRDDGLNCPIPTMISLAYDIGYTNVYIFTGGTGIFNFFTQNNPPKAVLGIACEPEIKEGLEKMNQMGVISQVEYLLEDGCAETTLFKNKDFEEDWKLILTRFPPKQYFS